MSRTFLQILFSDTLKLVFPHKMWEDNLTQGFGMRENNKFLQQRCTNIICSA